jgi:hypothetical protein
MDQESSVSYMDCLFGILASSKETEERFGLIEMVAPRGPRALAPPPPHRRRGLLRARWRRYLLRRGGDLQSRPWHVRLPAARRGTLLYFRDRCRTHALRHRARRVGSALPGCSFQRAAPCSDAATASGGVRNGYRRGDGQGPGQLWHRGMAPRWSVLPDCHRKGRGTLSPSPDPTSASSPRRRTLPLIRRHCGRKMYAMRGKGCWRDGT